MAKNSPKALELAVRAGRSLLHPEIVLEPLADRTPSELAGQVMVARIASIDARSEGVRIGDSTVVIVDRAQARWIYALCLVRKPSEGKGWPLYLLHNYYTQRLVGAGLPNEARAASHRLRQETRLLQIDDTFDIAASEAAAERIERFILGHELGHVAYRAGGPAIERLMASVHRCSDELTRLLKVTFTGDRSTLTAYDLDPRYEDIVASMKDYLSRFIFHEYADDIKKYERDLLARADVKTLQARRHRWDAFADVFDQVDFIEEAFCDMYALEFRLLDAEASGTPPGEIVTEVWRNLHAMFALTALDSLARDRQVAAGINARLGALLHGIDVSVMSEDEIHALHDEVEAIEAGRNADRALLFYQIAMLKAVYRRVVFMNYIAQHPLLARPEILRALEEEGESLEGHFIGACATLRFNGIRLEVDHKAGYRDALEAPDRVALDALWSDFLVRVPGMDQLVAAPPTPRFRCGFCGGDAATERLIVTSGRVAICDQCTFTAEAAFAAMPAGRPRREQVGYGVLVPPPDEPLQRAQPDQPHCHFCAMAPARGEPLVSASEGCMICAICVEAVAKVVRMKSRGSDPNYAVEGKRGYEGMFELARSFSAVEQRQGLMEMAEGMRADYEREINPTFPGQQLWRLFTEPTLAPAMPHRPPGSQVSAA